MRKRIKKMLLYLLSFFAVLSIAVLLFLKLYPSFGGSLSKAQKQVYEQFNNYADGKFVNEVPTSSIMTFRDKASVEKASVEKPQHINPKGQIPVSEIDWSKIKSNTDSVTWLGHSAFLLSIDNKKILLDPMLGPIASPVSFVGIKRYKYSKDLLQTFDEMPPIDAVLITHDHYDHLDYQSTEKLKNKVGHFFVPHGVGAHLTRWGVAEEKITELNWWDETKFQGLTVALTPAKHFSGRGIFDRNRTLWGGWVILGKNTRLYYSGDGGYDAHFKKIGKKYGPFDITLIEGGQYDRRWSWVHMTPEEAVQAHRDVNGKNMILMHWGAFTLARHGWKEPIERALIEAEKTKVNLLAPKIGETVPLDSALDKFSSWWKSVQN